MFEYSTSSWHPPGASSRRWRVLAFRECYPLRLLWPPRHFSTGRQSSPSAPIRRSWSSFAIPGEYNTIKVHSIILDSEEVRRSFTLHAVKKEWLHTGKKDVTGYLRVSTRDAFRCLLNKRESLNIQAQVTKTACLQTTKKYAARTAIPWAMPRSLKNKPAEPTRMKGAF